MYYCNVVARRGEKKAKFDQISSVRRESNSGAYFAGMFRVANVEFIPEYRQAESHEFVSMANKIQHVVGVSVTLLVNCWSVLICC